jgi:hypothetical protein
MEAKKFYVLINNLISCRFVKANIQFKFLRNILFDQIKLRLLRDSYR